MAVEAAHLFVGVTADTDKASRNLGNLNQQAQKSQGFLKGAAGQAVGFGAAMVGVAAGSAAFGFATDSIIGMNANLEKSTLQFETLMGDADKAREHVESLFEFGATTPFETGPIIEASRLMETFGGSALNTKDNLRAFGDAAAATGNNIDEVGFWMSRAYAAIDAGKPWGEAAQRLGEMGIVTPQVRAKLEELQKSGAKGPEVWSALTGELDRFGGAMEKQAGTWDGMMSTLVEGAQMMIAKAALPLFEALKGVMGWMTELMSSPGFNGALEGALAGIGAAFGLVKDVLLTVWSAVSPIIDAFMSVAKVLQSGDDVASGLGETLGNLAEQFGTLGTTIQDAIFGALESVLAQIPAFATAFFDMASSAVDAFVEVAPLVIDQVLMLVSRAVDWVLTTGIPMAADALGAFALAFIEWVGPAAGKLAEMLPVIGEKIFSWLAAMLPVVVEKFVEFAGAFVNWVITNVLPRLPGVLATVAGAIIGWIARTAPVVIGRMAEMGGKLLGVVGEKFRQLPVIIGTWLSAVVPKVTAWAGEMLGKGVAAAAGFAKSILDRIMKVPGEIMAFLNTLPGLILGWGTGIAKGAGKAAVDFVKAFINGIASLPGKVADAVRSAFANLRVDIGPFHISGSGVTIDLPNIQLPSFATGAWNLPHDMVAQVHAGEMIVPKDIAERLRGGRGMGNGGGGGGGGGDTFVSIVVPIENYRGDTEHLDALQRGLGEAVRTALPRRTTATVR